MKYNLDETTQASFEFIVSGYTYSMRYPTTEEIFKLSKLSDKDGESATDYMLSFISSISDDAPDFRELFKTLTVPTVRAFNAMMLKEFGVNGND